MTTLLDDLTRLREALPLSVDPVAPKWLLYPDGDAVAGLQGNLALGYGIRGADLAALLARLTVEAPGLIRRAEAGEALAATVARALAGPAANRDELLTAGMMSFRSPSPKRPASEVLAEIDTIVGDKMDGFDVAGFTRGDRTPGLCPDCAHPETCAQRGVCWVE